MSGQWGQSSWGGLGRPLASSLWPLGRLSVPWTPRSPHPGWRSCHPGCLGKKPEEIFHLPGFVVCSVGWSLGLERGRPPRVPGGQLLPCLGLPCSGTASSGLFRGSRQGLSLPPSERRRGFIWPRAVKPTRVSTEARVRGDLAHPVEPLPCTDGDTEAPRENGRDQGHRGRRLPSWDSKCFPQSSVLDTLPGFPRALLSPARAPPSQADPGCPAPCTPSPLFLAQGLWAGLPSTPPQRESSSGGPHCPQVLLGWLSSAWWPQGKDGARAALGAA